MLIPTAILLAAFALRAAPLTQNRFHPDEALYATFARLIASGRDPMLSTIVVDKPPLPFYLMAASMAVFGPTEFAARLPSLLAGIASAAVLYRLGAALYDKRVGGLASLVLALSPLAILFAITLFTDTLLVAFLLWSALAAARGRWPWAGLAFGLAFACKQTAVFFLPLIIAFGVVRSAPRSRREAPSPLAAAAQFLWPAALCAVSVFIWDYARRAPISFWAQGYSDNNPGRLVRSNEIWPRLGAWIELLHFLTGSRLAEAVLLVGLPALLVLHGQRTRAAVFDFILSGFALAFLAVYWLLAFNVWDRYLLALTPPAALLLGRIMDTAMHWIESASARLPLPSAPRLLPRAAASLFVLSLLPPALAAARSDLAVGGDHGAYDGIDEIAAALRAAPAGSVLYDHWLSWEWGFYLFDGPVYLSWFPGPESLADDLKSFGRASPRYIVAPSWESFAEVRRSIESAGFTLHTLQTSRRRDGTVSFTLYRIEPNEN